MKSSRTGHRWLIAVVATLALQALSPSGARAQEPATVAAAPAAASGPDLATRVADLEAYLTNSAPKALNVPGPGHNAWMMTSTALVLFMTLPGLALFYGDSRLAAPVYDYARLFVASRAAVVAELGPEELNANYRAPAAEVRPFAERHPELLWIALIAAICALGVVAMRSAKSSGLG